MSSRSIHGQREGNRILAAVIGGTAVVLAASATAQAGRIRWQSGDFKMLAKTPVELQQAFGELGQPGVARHVVVQFDAPIQSSQQAKLKAAGLTLESYLGDNAFFAVLNGGAMNAETLSRVASLATVEPIQTEWKLHPRLASGDVPTWAVVGPAPNGESIVGAYILFHPDVALVPDGVATAARHGAQVRSVLESINGLVIELPQNQIEALAAEDAVQWIEPPLPRFSTVNDSNRALTQADTVQAAPYGLDGSGVTVLVYDGGTARATHQDFGGRLTVYDASGMDDHPTHVCGTIGGSGAASGGTYKGMAPAVTLLSYGFEWDSSGVFLYNNPGDLEDDYDEAINVRGADISNSSIGTNTALYWDCEITGDYGITSELIDTIVRGDGSNPAFDQPFRVVWSNGNERQTTRCGDTYSTTAPPAGAKNHITVGAVNSNDDSMTSFSSWGPVDDGRLKPDVCGPGCQSNGDGGVTSTFSGSDTEYGVYCGTSMSSPTVCGLSALMIEDFRAQYPGQPLFRNSTLKAWLAHTAVDRGNTGPDYQFGYGSVRIQSAIDFMRTGAFVENSVSQGSSYSCTVVVSGGDPELKVTLAWDDVPGTPNVDPALVNDLDLRVFGPAPSSTRYYPWTLDPGNPASPAVQTQEDHINNIEQVLVNDPQAGTWTIEVYGYNVPSGPQSFSLVGDGATNVGTSIGFPGGLPATMTPGTPYVIDVEVVSVGETTVPGSPTMYYRYDGGTFQTSALTFVSGNLYQGTLPAAGCSDSPEFYFSAEGSITGVVYQPGGAPTTTFTATVGAPVTIFSDNFETDQGWTPSNLGATSGDWQRGVPVDDPSWAYDPASDSDGSGQCFLTQNETGNTDVDAGAVALTSPTIDMSGGNITITYDYFLRLTDTGGGVDRLLVETNNNDGVGTWTEIARHITDGGLSWRNHVIDQADLDAAGVTLTSTMKLRFTANDADPQSINESGLDAFVVSGFACVGATCSIGGQEYTEGETNPANDCEFCDPSADPNNWSPRPSGTACGDQNDTDCDNPNTCDGAGTCLDNYEPPSAECRPAAGDCDVAEFCPGDSADCPIDGFEPDTVECRVSAGDCDVAEFCPGNAADCPTDTFEPDTAECRASAGDCDVAEFCPGNAADCPVDGFEPDTLECRASAGECDVAEFCPGDAADCPTDAFEPSGTPCTDDGNVCTDNECDGNGNCTAFDNTAPCDDGTFCDGDDTCSAGTCATHAGDPCAGTEWCYEAGTTCVPYGDGDFDSDTDLDLKDFGAFQACFGQLGLGGCEPGNLTGDGMIDLDDFAQFVAALGGPL